MVLVIIINDVVVRKLWLGKTTENEFLLVCIYILIVNILYFNILINKIF